MKRCKNVSCFCVHVSTCKNTRAAKHIFMEFGFEGVLLDFVGTS